MTRKIVSGAQDYCQRPWRAAASCCFVSARSALKASARIAQIQAIALRARPKRRQVAALQGGAHC